jgi:UDP-glucose 4-epimerase
VAAALLGAMGSALDVEHGPARTVNPVARRLADTRRAREELGFTAAIPLGVGLQTLVEWWRRERAGAVRV